MRSYAAILVAVVTGSIVTADPNEGGIRGSNSGGDINLRTSFPDVAEKFEDGVQRFYERATTTAENRKYFLNQLLSATSPGTNGDSSNGRKLLSDTCVNSTDAIYDAIDPQVKALFDSSGSCGPQLTYMPSITATIDHKDCSAEVVQNHTDACIGVNGTIILANLNAECKIYGMIPFIPITAFFEGKALNICMSNDQCTDAEVAAIDNEAATGLVDMFMGDLAEGFGISFDMTCHVKGVEQVTNSTAQ